MRTFRDTTFHLSFDYPADWIFAESDHQISTFHLDARTAPRKARLRAVVAMPTNPFPASTFSGAYLYFSVTPHTSPSACARQAIPPKMTHSEAERRKAEKEGKGAGDSSADKEESPTLVLGTKPVKIQIAGIPFTVGRDEQRQICLVQHDDVYTTVHAGGCYRFDLTINNFCGGEVSGVRDITGRQLDQIRSSLLNILSSVRFRSK